MPDRLGIGRVEAEVRPLVRDAEGEHPARERESLARPEHGLVGEVEDDVRAMDARRPPRPSGSSGTP